MCALGYPLTFHLNILLKHFHYFLTIPTVFNIPTVLQIIVHSRDIERGRDLSTVETITKFMHKCYN